MKHTSVQKLVTRLMLLWIFAITVTISYLSQYASKDQKQFYRFGPNSDLRILGFTIDNSGKYFAVVLYCFVNSIARALHHAVLSPWLINNVQDESKRKPNDIHLFAYEITCVTTLYVWFDWFIYMNILLSQVDMVIVEIIADLVMSIGTTMYYLHQGNHCDHEVSENFLQTIQ